MAEERYSGSRFKKAVVVFLAGRAMQGGANVLMLLWLIRLLPVSEYGAYITVLGLVEFLVPLSSFGTLDAIRCYVPRVSGSAPATRALVRRLVKARSLAIALIMAGLLLFWMPLMTVFHFTIYLKAATRFSPILIGGVILFRVFVEILEALLEQRLAQASRTLLPVGKMALIGLCLLLAIHIDLFVIMLIEISITLVCLLLSVSFLDRTLGSLSEETIIELPDRNELAIFQRHMTISEWTNSLTGIGAIRMIVTAKLGLDAAAVFGFLHNLQQIIFRYLPANLLTNLIQPVLVSRCQSGQSGQLIHKAGNFLLKINWLVIGVALVVTAVGGDALIIFLSGGKFAMGSQTLFLLILTLIPVASRMILTMLLQISSLTNVLKIMSVASPILFIFLLFIADYGLNIFVGTLLIFSILWNVVTLRIAQRQGFEFQPDLRAIFGFLIAASVSITIGIFFKHTFFASDNETIILLPFSALLAFVMMIATRPWRKAEVWLAESTFHTNFPSWLSK